MQILVAAREGRVVGVVSADVKDIKKIEKVTIRFTQEVAAAVRKANVVPEAVQNKFDQSETADMGMNAPTIAEQSWTDLTLSGEASNLTTIEITTTIAAPNKNQHTVTLAGTGGRTRTVCVPPTAQGVDQLEVGDMVVLEITRSTIVNVKVL